MGVIRVKPYGKNQGDFVLMNELDFDPARFSIYDPEGDAKRAKAEADAIAKAKLEDELEAQEKAEAAKVKPTEQPAVAAAPAEQATAKTAKKG